MTDDSTVKMDKQATAVCPYCDRTETFDQRVIGQAWLIGHIHTEHITELPDIGGVE